MERQDIDRLKVRSTTGELVPLGTLVEIKDVSGPNLVQRYNMYVSVPVQGNAAPGVSSDQALDTMEALAERNLPPGTDFEWTELAYQERNTGNTAVFIFALSVLFVFLALAAQYESWSQIGEHTPGCRSGRSRSCGGRTVCSATQCTSPGRSRATRPPASSQTRPSIPWRRWPSGTCHRVPTSSGPSWPTRSVIPATRRSSSSRSRCSSCFSPWRRSTRAGACPWRSS